MTVIRGNPADLKTPALRREIVVKAVNGQLVASKWPRKRGPPTSPAQIEAVEWLKWSARIFPYIDGLSMDQAIDWTKGTGLYPRDLVTMALKGNLAEMVFEDGSTVKGRTEELECLVFNGAVLELDADVVLAASVVLAPVWPLPVVDTFSFWNAGIPTVLTIPTGVSMVQLTMGGRISSGALNGYLGFITDKAGSVVAMQESQAVGFQSVTVNTGPMPVRGGDFFTANFLSVLSRTLRSTDRPFFSLQVLEAICP